MSDIIKIVILFPFLFVTVRAVDLFLQNRKQQDNTEEGEKIPVRSHRREVKSYLRSKSRKRKKSKKNNWWRP